MHVWVPLGDHLTRSGKLSFFDFSKTARMPVQRMKSQRNYFLNYHQVVCLGRAKEIHKSHSFSFGAVDKKQNLVNHF